MLHAIWVLAAEESEPSKLAFYICGSILAVWAVVLSFLGLTRPEFPANSREARAVMGTSAVLVVAAMATAVITG